MRDLLDAAGRRDPASVRMLASAHASHEELFLLKQLAAGHEGRGRRRHVHVTWRRSEKQQPAETKFRVPATDAPNVTGAAALGLAVGAGLDGDADLRRLRAAVDQGRVGVLYVVDPGPGRVDGRPAVGRRGAQRAAASPVLIYQGVLATALSKVADVVLPGAAWVEKDATYTNDQGIVQAASKAINPPGEAVEDWQILTSVAAALGLPFTYTSSQQVRADVARRSPTHRATRTWRSDVQPARAAEALAAGEQPDGAVEVERHVPGPAARQGPQRADGKGAAGRP